MPLFESFRGRGKLDFHLQLVVLKVAWLGSLPTDGERFTAPACRKDVHHRIELLAKWLR